MNFALRQVLKQEPFATDPPDCQSFEKYNREHVQSKVSFWINMIV